MAKVCTDGLTGDKWKNWAKRNPERFHLGSFARCLKAHKEISQAWRGRDGGEGGGSEFGGAGTKEEAEVRPAEVFGPEEPRQREGGCSGVEAAGLLVWY
jgi:hypothetical protein